MSDRRLFFILWILIATLMLDLIALLIRVFA